MRQLLRLLLFPRPSKIRPSPRKRQRKISQSPMKFEISGPPATPQERSLVKDPRFASTLAARTSRGKSGRSGWDRRAAPLIKWAFHRDSLL